jgi:hypothetical protein
MSDILFRAYKYNPPGLPGRAVPLAYFIESTAPDDIDREAPIPHDIPGLDPIANPDDAIADVARRLAGSQNPTLVVSVHGFSTPRDAVLKRYRDSFGTVHSDTAIAAANPVCLGYRWPSEAMGTRLFGWLPAAPLILQALLVAGLIFFALYWVFRYAPGWEFLAKPSAILAAICLILPIASFVLRGVVYFRDTYRATHYGVPDLVEIIRQIDTQIMKISPNGLPNPVTLSFMGHSMGAFVVTNTVRILSNVFLRESVRDGLNEGVVKHKRPAAGDPTAVPEPDVLTFVPPKIGNVFELKRLVLVSPDIPAEALIANRANFLEASLRRFKEAYLFSNGQDEVLRQISTIANSFSFPTRSWKYGFRLGNVEVVSRDVASAHRVARPDPARYMNDLRIGYFSLAHLNDKLHIRMVQNALPLVFSYFDCTDYSEGGRRFLSLVQRKTDRKNRLMPVSAFQHVRLLFAYFLKGFRKTWPDVHSGYFDADATTSNRLIHRLACLGYDAASHAFQSEGVSLLDACHNTGIQVLLSPYVGANAPLKQERSQGPAGLAQRPAPSHATMTTPEPGRNAVWIPSVVGMQESEARNALQNGLPLWIDLQISRHVDIKVTPEKSPEPAGTVIRQTPAPGNSYALADTVELWVSQGL